MKEYTPEVIAGLLPHPAADANKYTRGRLTLVVGGRRYPGAAYLAAVSAQRAGAGYTEAFVDDPVVEHLQLARPSLVVRPWSEWEPGRDDQSTPRKPRAYVAGCGFDADDPFIIGMVQRLLKAAKAPVLVDGGALRVLSTRKLRELCERRYHEGHPTIMTPHGGEAASLARPFALPTADPEALCVALSQAYGAICVLKGPDTFVSDGDSVHCMREGTAALAKAGTGDVLAGVVGALLAQGLGPIESCVLGATLHARAANLAAADLTDICVCAEDVAEYLPAAVRSVGEAAG